MNFLEKNIIKSCSIIEESPKHDIKGPRDIFIELQLCSKIETDSLSIMLIKFSKLTCQIFIGAQTDYKNGYNFIAPNTKPSKMYEKNRYENENIEE